MRHLRLLTHVVEVARTGSIRAAAELPNPPAGLPLLLARAMIEQNAGNASLEIQLESFVRELKRGFQMVTV